ncbi:TetR family transcriptional regulator [Kriegella sp. EG-1]|nr:TetR family transcriptional regulator [Flavobacteriaceae bacterium EG-1]
MSKKSVKEKIISAASELFYFEGYNQIEINNIIDKANVSRESLYNNFCSKEEIGVAYLETRQQSLMNEINKSLSIYNSGYEKVIALFDFLTTWLCETDYRGCGFQNIISEIPDDHNLIKKTVRNAKNELHQFVCKQLKFNIKSKKVASDYSNQIIVLLEGAIILAQIQKDTWPIIAAKKACEKVLEI